MSVKCNEKHFSTFTENSKGEFSCSEVLQDLMTRYPECEIRHPGFDSHSLMYMFTFNLCCRKLNIYIKFHLTQ